VMFWMGVAFEMPLIIFVLAKANVINANLLKRHWRWAVVIVAVLAALITPTPDPLNMSIVMVPLLLLYGLSIILAYLARRNATVPALLDPNEKVKEHT
jgi:sec-independent protein translocase protein TatC